MEISFVRMNGLGNRFAIVDSRTYSLSAEQEQTLAHRIEGLDQLLLLERARDESADIFMKILNRDGSEASACGNGVRCVAWLALEAINQNKQAGEKQTTITIETLGGLVVCRQNQSGEQIEANMGSARWQWEAIPLSQPRETLNIRFDDISAPIGLGTAINVGNPHIVFFPKEESFDWQAVGKVLEKHPLFPQGVNVSFAQIEDEGLKLNVWERGAGATQACGTAACAALVAACRRYPVLPRALPVRLPGGDLEIYWQERDNQVFMTGAVAWEGANTLEL